MAITAIFSPGTVVLSELGDELDNTIITSRDAAGKILVNGRAVSIDGAQATVADTSVINVFGDTLNGGRGDDTVVGGKGNDFRHRHSCALSMWRWLKISLFHPYRPELHYMRGPGPKSLEKYARGAGFAS
jgi:hypothetical protein